jgi:hypothetical protein
MPSNDREHVAVLVDRESPHGRIGKLAVDGIRRYDE